MNQRVENELRSILADLQALGLGENDLITDCLSRDGIEIPHPKVPHFVALLGLLFVGLGYYGFFMRERVPLRKSVSRSSETSLRSLAGTTPFVSPLRFKLNRAAKSSNAGTGITAITANSTDSSSA